MTEELSNFELREEWASGRNPTIVDVRSVTEYASGHIAGAVNVPLPELGVRREDIRGDDLVLVCERGTRARMARMGLLPCFPEARVLRGGMHAWRADRFPIVQTNKASWSLERQVRLGAGSMMLAGVALALTVGRIGLLVAAIPAAGLVLAGLTDICPLGLLLGRMPWNRICEVRREKSTAQEALAK